MTDSAYQLVFHGEFIEGADPLQAKAKFAQLFKMSETKVERIFAQPKVVIRKGLSEEQAEHYRQWFEKIGMQTHVKAASSPAVFRDREEGPAPQMPTAAPTAAEAVPPAAATAETQVQGDPRQLAFTFSGEGGEYFKIWIVNILLTILTLGIYSAWAKVRNKQYFYGNTSLEGSSFVYLAKPITILKGRLVAFALFGLYVLVDAFMPILSPVFSILLIILVPFLVVRSMAFNARNSAFRNVCFGFDGNIGGAYVAFLLWPLLGAITFGLLMPLALQRQQKYIIDNSRYGSSSFSFEATPGDYYQMVLRLIGVLILGGLLSFGAAQFFPPLAPVLMILLYLYAIVYFNVAITNITYNNSLLADHGFICNYDIRSYTTLFLTNSIATVITLGLFIPWAKVRNARYLAEHLEFVAASELDGFTAKEGEKVSAIGQEIGDVFDMDIGL